MLRNKNILIVDQDKNGASEITRLLKKEGFNVIQVGDAQEAINTCIRRIIDLIILETNLVGSDGTTVIEYVRQFSRKMPIIVVSNRVSIESKLLALGMGANDYLTKPYNSLELLARVKNNFRFGRNSDDELFINGYLTIDSSANIIYLNGNEVHFTFSEYKMLCLFADNINKVVTYSQIITSIWGEGGNNENGVRVFINGIRNKIKKECGNSDILKTEVGTGYRMIRLD